MHGLKIGNKVKVNVKNGYLIGEVTDTYPEYLHIRTDEGITAYVPYTCEWEKIPSSKKMEKNDTVNNPKHYTYGNVEIIDVIEQVTGSYSSYLAFMMGNVIKYVSRAPHKNKIEDLKKAQWYLERAIKKWEEKADEK
ncbi:DUF3310 domain-containing protein [Staphylococcus sp. IVB6227]|uniref:DUF3310 domain-containing protein n=1 Tax=Staphylococcus sp. IVB6227 TaxID=2989768 RepID=UPI0021D03845|nr:DUF3310 domain-containing protein [Staphylococcus sp. IVB6227]UXR77651.1 DUF3310 domain-containing protein [Staphylococcus sp. IVB6227]